jgi:hypothetical protein
MTTRFFGGLTPLQGVKSKAQAKAALEAMAGDNYLQCRDRDAQHLLGAANLLGDLVGMGGLPLLRPQTVTDKLNKLLRAMDKGQGSEFTRVGTEEGDDGLSEKQVRSMAEYLIWLANAAAEACDPIVVLCFSREQLGMPK